MKFLNLSNALHFEPAIAFKAFVFSGGEPHIKISDRVAGEQICITVQARTTQDILMTLLAHDALIQMGASSVDLFIPYFPAARQDRLMVAGEPLSVRVYADLINAAAFRKVTVFDPHSEVAPALLRHCVPVNNHAFVQSIQEILGHNPHLVFVAPDAGSAKKIHHLSSALQWFNVVQCDKTRDIKTGLLSAPKVFSDDLQGADCLIIDDICDGGGTFIQLAEALKAKNAGRLYLAVSHGIFSKGIDVLQPHFERIFTTNSFYNGPSTPFIHVHTLDIIQI